MRRAPWSALGSPRFRGVLNADAVWFPVRSTSAAQTLTRALGFYGSGARLQQTPLGLVVEFAKSRALDCASALGAPLQRRGQQLLSASFDKTAREALGDGWLLLLEGGEICVIATSECRTLDLAPHVDLEGFRFERVTSLGAPPVAPRVTEAAVDPSLGVGNRAGRDETREEHNAVIEQWNKSQQANPRAAGDRNVGSGAVQPNAGVEWPLAEWLVQALGGLLGVLALWLPAPSTSDGAAQERSSRSLAPIRQTPAWWQQWSAPFLRLLQRLALRSGLGRKQAQYVENLLSLLARQDDLQALKHAIPLGGSNAGGNNLLALLPPSPRSALNISRRLIPGGGSLQFEGNIYDHLQRAYERMFERLDARGQFNEAAFVLAELLRDAGRAVTYLERRGELRLAAELAEGRGLAADLIVRQWFVAGERERAIAVAVRENAFADAIRRLQRQGESDAAAALSALYAERLADAGHLVQAARVVGDLPALRPLAQRWLAFARSTGECAGLGLELEWEPGLFADIWRAAEPLLQGEQATDVAARVAFGHALSATQSDAAKPLARALTRQLVADAGRDGVEAHAKLASSLARWVGGALDADLPHIASHAPRPDRDLLQRRHTLTAASGECIHDVHRFGKHWLAALGEGGVALLDRQGKRIAHFDAPAEHLVTAPNSPHVLALAKRGGSYRITRIHAATRRTQLWTELCLDAFASSFDGERWAVALGDGSGRPASTETALSILDVLAETPRVLKRLPLGDEFSVLEIRCLPQDCMMIAAAPGEWPELLRYSLPAWQLRSRAVYPGQTNDKVFCGMLAADEAGPCWLDSWINRETHELSPLALHRAELHIPLPQCADPGYGGQLLSELGYFALTPSAQSGQVIAGSFAAQRVTTELTLEGSEVTTLRLEPPLLYFGDRAGRIFIYDLKANRELAVLTPR